MTVVSPAKYFDHNATSPLREVARRVFENALDEAWSNPSSPHASGARCRVLLEEARKRLSLAINGVSEGMVFTSGATEGNNAVFAHFRDKLESRAKVAISAVEHPSVLESAKIRFGQDVLELPLNQNGALCLDGLADALGESELGLVSVMAANNETGILHPWPEALALCREARVPFHCDATQWIGRMPIDDFGACDLLTGSFHKLGGPKGVGFLWTSGAESVRWLVGGEQEGGLRAGTENVPAILAAVSAVEDAALKVQDSTPRDRFETRVKELVSGVQVLGAAVERLPNVSSLILPVCENLRWVNRLDRLGFAVSTGSACATGKEGPSHVLAAMGLKPEESRRAVRVSGGWTNGMEDWLALADAFGVVFEELKVEEGDSQVISL
ncbi:MAG: cysteine desulfurase family protein [Opitutales bacterium]